MAVKFLHSADWQIGKVFKFVDTETMGVLQEARLNAINKLGKIAVDQELGFVVVAGDVYDAENLSARSENQALERMRKFSNVQWFLLPGNHDPHRPNGLWDRLRKRGLPDNVNVCDHAQPVKIESDNVAILPAPLHYKATLRDPTEYMDEVELHERYIRIGLAHGSITTFGSDEARNYINPGRCETAGLAYLAMGDWHGQREINSRCWYSGTPEIDGFSVDGGGKALIVTVHAGTHKPDVESVNTTEFKWETLDEKIYNSNEIDLLQEKLSNLGPDLERILVRLKVEGAVSLEEHRVFDEKIVERFDASFRYFSVEDEHLHSQMTEDDINRIDTGGFVRKAADELRKLAKISCEEERRLAELALKRLYVELVKLET